MVEWWCVLRWCVIFVWGMVVEYGGMCYGCMLGVVACVMVVCYCGVCYGWYYGVGTVVHVGSGGVCYGGVSYCCVGMVV